MRSELLAGRPAGSGPGLSTRWARRVMPSRKSIPKRVEKRLFQEANSRCCVCSEADVDKLVIHHIVPYAQNPDHVPWHMLVLCANCHALADRGQISINELYEVKMKAQGSTVPASSAEGPSQISVTGEGNVVAGRDVTYTVKIPRGKRGSAAKNVVIPGTVSENPRMIGYLRYLVDRYNKFKEWECGITGQKMVYPLIYRSYKRDMKYDLKHTPASLFESAVSYLRRRIENTRLAKTRRGQKLYSSFEEFDRPDT